ncbi:MAG: hypothetical protein K0Q74_1553 [Gammaproteobacteria bacterium]|jgi:hypothetical protein|nr:hypothetical protein [Gammaproteobacteria bacterium]
MCRKIFAGFFFILALVMGLLVSILPQDQLANLFYVSRFIEVMIPILGVGALLKYLFFCSKSSDSNK